MYQHEKRKAHSHTSRSSGVRETSLSAIPTDSATGNTSQGASNTAQSQTTDASKPSWYGKTPEQMTRKELAEYTEYLTGNRVITDGQMSNEVVDLQG